MSSVGLPEWVHDLVVEARHEFPGLTSGYNYDDWSTFEEYGNDLRERLKKAREAKANGTLDEYMEELRNLPLQSVERAKKLKAYLEKRKK